MDHGLKNNIMEDIEKAKELILKEKQKREQLAISEFNDFVKIWSEKHNVQLSITQPQITITAI